MDWSEINEISNFPRCTIWKRAIEYCWFIERAKCMWKKLFTFANVGLENLSNFSSWLNCSEKRKRQNVLKKSVRDFFAFSLWLPTSKIFKLVNKLTTPAQRSKRERKRKREGAGVGKIVETNFKHRPHQVSEKEKNSPLKAFN